MLEVQELNNSIRLRGLLLVPTHFVNLRRLRTNLGCRELSDVVDVAHVSGISLSRKSAVACSLVSFSSLSARVLTAIK